MWSSVGHGWIQKFDTLMNIPNLMTVKTITKKSKNMIDAVNVVDIIVYQRYWENKIRVRRALSKASGNPVMKPKQKRKRTSWEVSSNRHHNWSTVKLWRCS